MLCPRCGCGAPADAPDCPTCGAALHSAMADVAAGPRPLAEPEPVAGIPGIDRPGEGPPANYLAPGTTVGTTTSGGELRVSLTGEVLEVPPPTPRTTGPVGAAGRRPGVAGVVPPPGMRPVAPPPRERGAGPVVAARGETARGLSGSSTVAIVLLVIVVLAAGGGFGYWYWQKQRAPVVAAERFMEAVKTKNWDTVMGLVEWPAQVQGQQGMIKAALTGMGQFVEVKSYKVNGAQIEGETAKVSITATAQIKGGFPGVQAGSQTNTGDVPFRLVNGQWKLDGAGVQGMGLPGLGPAAGGAAQR